MKLALTFTLLMGIIILPTGCVTNPRGFRSPIENFDKVDDKLYRGAQPNALGIEHLKSLGVVAVINLRGSSDTWSEEQSYVTNARMQYASVPLDALSAPSKADIERILAAISRAGGPVFVHCQFGCDRTGTVVACYRIRVQGQTPDVALQDAEQHGMSAFEVGMKKFIRSFK
jgi:protein tyrosine/serine phosphatase